LRGPRNQNLGEASRAEGTQIAVDKPGFGVEGAHPKEGTTLCSASITILRAAKGSILICPYLGG
jgi:hypothetical protein